MLIVGERVYRASDRGGTSSTDENDGQGASFSYPVGKTVRLTLAPMRER